MFNLIFNMIGKMLNYTQASVIQLHSISSSQFTGIFRTVLILIDCNGKLLQVFQLIKILCKPAPNLIGLEF